MEDRGSLEEVQTAMVDMMSDAGASLGALYLLSPADRVLSLAILYGVSPQLAAPWHRVSFDARHPIPDAIRQRRIVWLGGRQEIAHRYPRLGFMLPFDVRLAIAPIIADAPAGGLALLWPASHPRVLSPVEQEVIGAFCRHVGQLARQGDRPLSCPDKPLVLPLFSPGQAGVGAGGAMADAADFSERLPVGCCTLDLDGRVTYINPAAIELLGGDNDLRGTRPQEVLPWLEEFDGFDSYRRATFSRRPTTFTAMRPPDRWLTFHLYPDTFGTTAQITPSAAPAGGDAPSPTHRPSSTADVATTYHLADLAAALAEAGGIAEVARVVVDQMVPAFNADAALLMTSDEGRLHVIDYRGFSAEAVDSVDGTALASRSPAARSLATGDARFFADFAEIERTYPDVPRPMAEDETSALAFLPLIVSGRSIGSLVVAHTEPGPYSQEERSLLTSLAGLIAQAVDRARYHDSTRDLAQTLQSALLPPVLPCIEGLDCAARYLPASHGMDIGGDFYDLLRPAETIATAMIGDVQGHSVTAAAVMGQIRSAVHAAAAGGMSPGDVLAGTNRFLIDLDPGLFTSCLIAEFDLARHSVRLATAGHPPPLIHHPDGRTEIPDPPPGLLLGIDADTDYPTIEIPLQPGTLLALYTDGLVEVPGADIDDTTTALAHEFEQAADQPIDTVADILLRSAPTADRQDDDTALLLVRMPTRQHAE